MVWLTVCFLIMCLPFSLFLWSIIYTFISKKPLVSVTLVDWIYRDTIVYIYLACCAYSIALIHTTFAGNINFTLKFEFAIFYAFLINFLINNVYFGLTIAGGLRLISLMNNSEAAGLQLLGPDNEAILKIRFASPIISFGIPCFVVNVLGAYPGLFPLFYRQEIWSNWDDIKHNAHTSLYLLFPFITLIVNVSVVVYSNFIRKQMKHSAKVFIIFGNYFEDVHVKKFSFSIIEATVFPFLTFTNYLQSFCDRNQRLLLISPFHIFICNVLLPACIIFNNNKIRQYSSKKYFFPMRGLFFAILSFGQKYTNKKIRPESLVK